MNHRSNDHTLLLPVMIASSPFVHPWYRQCRPARCGARARHKVRFRCRQLEIQIRLRMRAATLLFQSASRSPRSTLSCRATGAARLAPPSKKATKAPGSSPHVPSRRGGQRARFEGAFRMTVWVNVPRRRMGQQLQPGDLDVTAALLPAATDNVPPCATTRSKGWSSITTVNLPDPIPLKSGFL